MDKQEFEETYSGFIVTVLWYIIWYIYLSGMFDRFIIHLSQLYYNAPQ